MKSTTISSLLLGAAAAVVNGHPLHVRQTLGYADPTSTGGSMLTSVGNGYGEPLNVIISGNSDAEVLTTEGASEYFESLYYSPGSCLGVSAGDPQQADLGDGLGYRNQTDVLRFNYYAGDSGTCLESVRGGNHIRYWMQNGTSEDTNAIFIAASVEYPATQSHDIVPDGYDLGRDWLTGNATNSSGTTSPGGYEYTATMTTTDLLSTVNTSAINHGISVDGTVAVLTVKITKSGTLGANRTGSSSSSSSSTSGATRTLASPAMLVVAMMVMLSLSLINFTEAHPHSPRPSPRVGVRSASKGNARASHSSAQMLLNYGQLDGDSPKNVATSDPVEPIDAALRTRLTMASRLAASTYCQSCVS